MVSLEKKSNHQAVVLLTHAGSARGLKFGPGFLLFIFIIIIIIFIHLFFIYLFICVCVCVCHDFACKFMHA